MKKFLDPLATAWTSVATHKLRSFLTILGVVIGISAVITLMSVGKGTESQILSNFTSLGTNLVYVQPGSISQGGVRAAFGSATTLTLEDAEAIASEVSNINYVAPYSSTGFQVIYGSQNMFAQVTGVTPEYQQVFNIEIDSGEFISYYQYDRKQKVALIGSAVRETLFGEEDPVGQKVRLGSNVFTVTGVLKSKGASMMGSTDYAILIPLSTLQGMMSRSITAAGQHIVSAIALQAADQKYIETVKEDIAFLLQVRHNISIGEENDFTISSMDELIGRITETMSSLTLLLGAIAGISLLVGGIGVMNIMLVSVMERRREIGIRKALGAREKDIWGQFLIDAALLTFTGGLIGVGVGWGGSFLINSFGVVPTLVTVDIVILAVAVSVGIGLFFGFYPAWQGSRLDPIQALRAE